MFFIPCSFYHILSTHYQQLSLGYIVYINQYSTNCRTINIISTSTIPYEDHVYDAFANQEKTVSDI
jgi:hypothetical protein